MELVFALLIIVVAWVVLALGPVFLRSRERIKLLDLAKFAAERGETVQPEVISALPVETLPQANPRRDLRRGIFLVAVAAAIELIGLCVYLSFLQTQIASSAGAIGIGVAAVGALPGCIGIALIVLSLTNKASAEV